MFINIEAKSNLNNSSAISFLIIKFIYKKNTINPVTLNILSTDECIFFLGCVVVFYNDAVGSFLHKICIYFETLKYL